MSRRHRRRCSSQNSVSPHGAIRYDELGLGEALALWAATRTLGRGAAGRAHASGTSARRAERAGEGRWALMRHGMSHDQAVRLRQATVGGPLCRCSGTDASHVGPIHHYISNVLQNKSSQSGDFNSKRMADFAGIRNTHVRVADSKGRDSPFRVDVWPNTARSAGVWL